MLLATLRVQILMKKCLESASNFCFNSFLNDRYDLCLVLEYWPIHLVPRKELGRQLRHVRLAYYPRGFCLYIILGCMWTTIPNRPTLQVYASSTSGVFRGHYLAILQMWVFCALPPSWILTSHNFFLSYHMMIIIQCMCDRLCETPAVLLAHLHKFAHTVLYLHTHTHSHTHTHNVHAWMTLHTRDLLLDYQHTKNVWGSAIEDVTSPH